MNPLRVTLIISTYNWSEALDLVLRSALVQTVMPLEIIVADDGSQNDTAELIEVYQKTFPVPLIHQWHEDKGFRKTLILNQALKKAKGDYIIQIDGDIILHKDFIRDHINNATKGYFIKGSRGRLSKQKSKVVLESKKINFFPLEIGVLSRINATRLPVLTPFLYSDSKNTRNVKGCNFAFWKEDAICVNGYNNNLTGWGHEDIEFAARLVNFGVKKRQLKMAAVCYHIYHPLESRVFEDNNLKVYEEVVEKKIKWSANGISEI